MPPISPAKLAVAALLMYPPIAPATAVDDIKIEASQDHCPVDDATNENTVVYAANLNPRQTIEATFKYNSSPPQQHFILFDANLNPVTDRFPKSYARRINPKEKVAIGCTHTYRSAPRGSEPLSVPIVITQQAASYVDSPDASPPVDARAFAAFLLQGGHDECGAGSRPPGLLYLVNLHPFARLSVSLNLLDEHGTRVGAATHDLSAFGATRAGCSNSPSRPGPVTTAAIEVPEGAAVIVPAAPTPVPSSPAPERNDPKANEAAMLVPLPLGAILRAQNVCAGSLPAGWIKINDAWNPTVCGNPAAITYNVWTIQQFADLPIGAVIYACKGLVPSGWAIVGTGWNPTVCGHPAANQPNVMAIRRLS
jgi:hypothetical protein